MNDLAAPALSITYRIGDWLIDPASRALMRDGHRALLSPTGTDVLVYLAERPGVTVTHEELLAEFWRGPVSSPNAVHKCVVELRHALQNGDDARYIETVPRRGYRLIANVERFGGPVSAPTVSNGSANGTHAEQPSRPRWRRWALASVAVLALATSAYIAFSKDARTLPVEPNVADCSGCGAPTVPKPKRVTIVTPFTTSPGASDNASLGKVFAAALEQALASSPDYALTGASAERDVRTGYVLNGSVSGADDVLRVEIALKHAESGERLFTRHFEGSKSEMFELQDRMAGGVSKALSVHLDPKLRERMLKAGTSNADAYLAMMEARQYAGLGGRENLARALEYDRRALSLDPGFADVYGCIAMDLEWWAQFQSLDAYMAVVAELDALEVQASIASPKSGAPEVVAFTKARLTGDLASQERSLRALIKVRDAPARRYGEPEASYGMLLQSAGFFDDAKQYMWYANSIGPEREWLWQSEDITMWTVGVQPVLERRIAGLRGTLDGGDGRIDALTGLVQLLAHEKRLEEAERYMQALARLDKVGLWAHGGKAALDVFSQRMTKDSAEWKAFEVHPLTGHFLAGAIAFMLEDIDVGAKHWRQINVVERSILVQNRWYTEYLFPPSVRSDARYAAVLEELGIGETWRKQLQAGVRELEPVTGIALAAEHPERMIVGNWRHSL